MQIFCTFETNLANTQTFCHSPSKDSVVRSDRPWCSCFAENIASLKIARRTSEYRPDGVPITQLSIKRWSLQRILMKEKDIPLQNADCASDVNC